MFQVGDRVALREDFDNEPGILPKGLLGTVVSVWTGKIFETQYLVVFDKLPDAFLQVARHAKDEPLPMYSKELEKAVETLYEVTGIDKDNRRYFLKRGLTYSQVTEMWPQAARQFYSVDIRKITI